MNTPSLLQGRLASKRWLRLDSKRGDAVNSCSAGLAGAPVEDLGRSWSQMSHRSDKLAIEWGCETNLEYKGFMYDWISSCDNPDCYWKKSYRNPVAAMMGLETHWQYCQKKGREIDMGKSIGDIKGERGIGGPPMLHGTDLPKGKSRVTVVVKELREAPKNFNSPAILDFQTPVYEKLAWAVNLTNLRAMARLAGYSEDEVDNADFDRIAVKMKSKKLVLVVGMVNDPKKGKMVPSLFVEV